MRKTATLLASLSLFLFVQAATAAGEIHDRVAETIKVDNYVYVLLAESNAWLAVGLVDVQPGDRIEYVGGMPMKDFYSRELDRTFEDILFVSRLKVVEPADPHGSIADPHMAGTKRGVIPQGNTAISPAPGEIERLEGGMTIEEVWKMVDGHEGQKAKLRARVVKVSTNILNRNWITLEDGTGSPPENRLIATTSDTVNVGDTVIVNGIVKTNVDIGSGYTYRLVLEDASFSR
jgi:hypothetical protein